MVNGSASPAPAVAGDPIHVGITGLPSGIGVNVYLTDTTLSNQFHTVTLNPSPTSLDCIFPLTQESSIIQGEFIPLTAGEYAIAVFQVGNPYTPLASVAFSVSAYVTPPFPPFSVQNWILFNLAVSGTVLASSAQASAVQGTITIGGTYQTLEGFPHPTNVTMQFVLYGDASSGALVPTKRLIGAQTFDAGGFPFVPFDTTTVPDGTYMLSCIVVDCADTNSAHFSAYQIIPYPRSLIIMNEGAKAASGSYLIPAASLSVNAEVNSTSVDYVHYNGLPVYNTVTPYPYPGPGLSPVVAPPVTNSESPFHSNPAGARTGGYYIENSDTLNLHEYRRIPMFFTTNAGGVFAGNWSGEGGGEGVESTYPAMAIESWLDGPRNSHTATGNSIIVATVDPRRTGDTGPFDAYHWTIINIGGNLSVRDLAGNMLTIAGYKRDLSKLPIDYLDGTTAEFPNTVLVGTIDTAPATTFSDFGGGPNDCCWDPRNPNICYVAQTVDHCIVACDFTVQTIAGIKYGPRNPRLYRYAGYKGGLTGNGVGGYADGPALGSVVGSVQQADGAQFNGIYSICMQRVSGISGHPVGTMYVADNYNCLIRKITQSSPGVASTVSTLCGLAGGTGAPGTASGFINTVTASAIYSVTSIISNGDGTASVVLAPSPTSPVAGVGWKVSILVNGSEYFGGGPTFENSSYGIYTVSAFTNSQHFSLTMNPVPSSGTITAQIWVADHYSAPSPGGVGVAFSAANCYTAYPQTLRMTSTGDIVMSEAWYNMMLRRIWLSGSNANTITRIMPFGNLAQVVGPGFGFHDVDDVGACGPIDDIVCFKTDANPGSAGYTSRIAIDGSSETAFVGGDGGRAFPQENTGATGHYPWAFAFSKTQCRFIGAGKADTIFYSGRPFVPSIDSPMSFDIYYGNAGFNNFLQGTCSTFPWLLRPSFAALYGHEGTGLLGQNVVPTFDDLAALYPHDYSPFSGSLAQFIQHGMGGATLRPEFSMDDTVSPALPGRDLAQLLYFVRRQALPGSYPILYPQFLMGQDGAGSGALVSPNTLALNCVRPVISSVVATRGSNTSIEVTWNTDTPTIGLIAAGSPNSAGRPYPYNLWSSLESTYGTSHEVTISGLPDVSVIGNAPTHFCILVKDKAGNWARSPDALV